jgi:hypothetical protein
VQEQSVLQFCKPMLVTRQIGILWWHSTWFVSNGMMMKHFPLCIYIYIYTYINKYIYVQNPPRGTWYESDIIIYWLLWQCISKHKLQQLIGVTFHPYSYWHTEHSQLHHYCSCKTRLWALLQDCVHSSKKMVVLAKHITNLINHTVI